MFLSLNIEPNIKDEFFAVQGKLADSLSHLPDRAVKWEDRLKYHITLFFLGDVEKNKMDSLISKLDAFSKELTLEEIFFKSTHPECFPSSRNPRVIFADVENEDRKSYELYDKLMPVLELEGFKPDKKFHLHITFGRVKFAGKLDIEKQIENVNFNIEFSAKSFNLMQSIMDSRGSVYKVIKSFKI